MKKIKTGRFNFGGMGIGLKITLCMLLIIILAMGSLSMISLSYMSSTMQSSITSNLKNTAIENAKLLSQEVKAYKSNVENITINTTLQSSDWASQQKLLNKLVKANNYINLGVASTNGTIRYQNGQTANILASSYFKTALAGKTAISDPVKNSSGTSVIYVAAPIKNDSGKITGVVVATLKSTFLSNISSNVKNGNTDGAMILNSSGTTIVSPANMSGNKNAPKDGMNTSSQEGGPSAPQSSTQKGAGAPNGGDSGNQSMSSITSSKTGIITMNFNGTLNYMAHTPISGTDWYLSVMAKPSNLFSAVNSMMSIIILLCIIFGLIAIIICTLLIRFFVTRPLKKTVNMIEELSLGHLGKRLKIKSKDEVGKMAAAMNNLADTLSTDIVGVMNNISNGNLADDITMKDENDEISPVLKKTILTIRSITEETQNIIKSAESGNLEKRCDIQKYNGIWKLLAEEINGLMDCVEQPISEVSEVISKMSVNDFTAKVEGNYKGIFNDLAMQVGTVRERFLAVQNIMTEISRGDMHSLAQRNEKHRLSENDNLTPAITVMMQSIQNLIREVQRLTGESANGNVLRVRGNTDDFEGDYKKIVEGFNDTLDAISEPVAKLSHILEAMALNDYTSVIKNDCKGDFKLIEKAVSDVQQSLVSVQNTAVKIAQGDVSELEIYRKKGKKSNNDKLLPALTKMMESIESLIDETTAIAGSAANGELSIRGDESRFEGGYAEVIHSINGLLEAVESPFDNIKDVMTSLSNCRLDQRIEGEYKGDFKILIEAVNTTAATIKGIVNELSHKMSDMANGDLSIDELNDFRGDFKPMSGAVNAILFSLNNLIGSIDNTSDEVVTGATQVSQGSQLLSEGATRQASALDGLSSSITEIATQTKQNALNANEANRLVEQVKENASAGSRQMDNMLGSMTEISSASSDILKIINVIDDIAFQTNILSLNAAVEAARAGSNGKGFAVVAEEVRNLASRSADAAKNTAELIEGTISKVRAGTETADNVAESFKNIVKGVNEVSIRVGEIAVASNEQATGITNVDNGLQQISQVVQTNSASAEESAAASEELTGQAQQLKGEIAEFKLRK